MNKNEDLPAPQTVHAETPYRAVTFRLPEAHLNVLTALACVDDEPSICLADELRGAVGSYIARRLADPDLPSKVEAARRVAPAREE